MSPSLMPAMQQFRLTTRSVMHDLIYMGGTIAFFALMILFLAVCEKLGTSGTNPAEPS